MKKTYTTPQMEVTKLQQLDIICISEVRYVEGTFHLQGGGASGGRAALRDDFEEEEEIDFTDISF